MKELYRNCSTGYEKACIFRTMFGDDKKSVTKDKVFWKHLNEIYHIENVFLYQLNPNDFDTVPQFVIEQCDRIINENSNLNNNTEIGEVN